MATADLKNKAEMAGKKILIIDSDEFLAKLFEFKLVAAGFQATSVTLPSEIEKMLSAVAPHLVIIDIMLQGTDTYGLVGRLADKNLKDRPAVIVLSRFREAGCDKRVMSLGASACLITTECTPLQLVNHVREVLARHDWN